MRRVLLYFALKYQGNYKKIFLALKNKEFINKNELDEVESRIKCNYLTMVDPNYPLALRALSSPPIVLFYYGNIELLNNPNRIAIIGTRKNSKYGKDMAIKIVSELKDYQTTIVSGMALGIDSIAQNEALDNNIPTIAILGGGIDYCYPPDNIKLYERLKKEGLIMSEYPNDQVPEAQNFLIRNRIIAALSEKIVVVEASIRSGTMNTVAYGLDMGKDIYAVPSIAGINSGCNMLIKECAKLCESVSDIYD